MHRLIILAKCWYLAVVGLVDSFQQLKMSDVRIISVAYCSSIVWWSVERLQVQLCLFIVKISLLPWNRRWNKYIRICQSAQKLTISASLPHASFYYWCRPCSIYHVVLHDWKGDLCTVWQLALWGRYLVSIRSPVHDMTRNINHFLYLPLWAFLGGRFLLDLMWVCLLA